MSFSEDRIILLPRRGGSARMPGAVAHLLLMDPSTDPEVEIYATGDRRTKRLLEELRRLGLSASRAPVPKPEEKPVEMEEGLVVRIAPDRDATDYPHLAYITGWEIPLPSPGYQEVRAVAPRTRASPAWIPPVPRLRQPQLTLPARQPSTTASDASMKKKRQKCLLQQPKK